jgi:PAS domain-containing protein
VVRSGRLTRVLLVGSAAIATVWVGLASALVLAAGLGVGGAVAIAVAEVALIGLAIRRLPARSRASHLSERFERGFDDAAIGMMILSQQLRVLRVNEALCPLLGRGADELVGRSILDFTHPEDRQAQRRETRVDGRRGCGRSVGQALRAP